jgi:hypothetical protein
MAKKPYDFESSVAGIPCKVKVTYATKYIPESWNGPAEGGDFEFELLDKKCYRARWLEKKLTPKDVERLMAEYVEYQQAMMEDY